MYFGAVPWGTPSTVRLEGRNAARAEGLMYSGHVNGFGRGCLTGNTATGSCFQSHTDVICSFYVSVLLPYTAMEAGATITGTMLGLEPGSYDVPC